MFTSSQFNSQPQNEAPFTPTPQKTYLPGYLSANTLNSSPFNSNPYPQAEDEPSLRIGGSSPSHTLTRTLFGNNYQTSKRNDKGGVGAAEEDAPPVVSLMDVDIQSSMNQPDTFAPRPVPPSFPHNTPIANAPTRAQSNMFHTSSRSPTSLLIFGFSSTHHNVVLSHFETFGDLASQPSPSFPNALQIDYSNRASKEALLRSAQDESYIYLPSVGLIGLAELESVQHLAQTQTEGAEPSLSNEVGSIFSLTPKERATPRGTPVVVHAGNAFRTHSTNPSSKVINKIQNAGEAQPKVFLQQSSGGIFKSASDFIFGF